MTSFHRPARTYPTQLPSKEVTITPPQPPPNVQGGAASWLQFLLPMVGGLGSVAFIFMYPQRSPVMFIAIGAMLLASVGGGLLTRMLQKRNTRKQTEAMRAKYTRYLAQQKARLDELQQLHMQSELRRHPMPTVITSGTDGVDWLWERRPTDADFLLVRIGTSVAPLCVPLRLDLGNNPLAEFDTELLPQAQQLVAQYEYIPDVPQAINIHTVGSLAIVGDLQHIRDLARAMLVSIAALHAPDDVRFLVACHQQTLPAWSWLRWFPHARRLRQSAPGSQGETVAMIADTYETLQQLLTEQITPEIERRFKVLENRGSAREAPLLLPHLILILDDFHPTSFSGLAIIDTLLNQGASLGVSIICLVGKRGHEPTSLGARLDLTGGGHYTYLETIPGGMRIDFIQPDIVAIDTAEQIARVLAPLQLSDGASQLDLSNNIHLLDLLGIRRIETWNIAENWQLKSSTQLLKIPVGYAVDGTPLFVDLKESAEGGMGPHGLIIGATGSGKSELLRTIVASLAATHDPQTVNFVLADFKGGASFADLASLPHVAGMITNLQGDLSLVDRMRVALLGEIERRQQMLRVAGNLDSIRHYQRRMVDEQSLPPMPYLIIIVDEFAELLNQRPDFGEIFVAIGRVGRSIGMHLLLATQRLGEGRISAIEGHLRYRFCLRTFSAAESSAVIGAPDAFYLPPFPGLGYLKIDTLTRQFKTAIISAPYVPADDTIIALRQFTPTGRLASFSHNSGPAKKGSGVAAMDLLIERIQEYSIQAAIPPVHSVVLPPLPSRLELFDLLNSLSSSTSSGNLSVAIGILDVPGEQRQDPLELDFSGAGGHLIIVGAPQSGKSTLLQTIMASLLATQTPATVGCYCIDLGGGRLRPFTNAPHAGGVYGRGEREQMRRVVRHIRGIIDDREIFFRTARLDSMASYRQQRAQGNFADQPYGDVFLIIDDLAQLSGEWDGVQDELAEIATTGLTFGVHIIATANRWSEVRAKLKDGLGTRIELRLNDPQESELGRALASTLSQAPAGRGIVRGGGLFQTALAIPAGTTGSQQEGLTHWSDLLRSQWKGESVPPIRLLPNLVKPADVQNNNAVQNEILLGIEEVNLTPLGIDLIANGPHFLIFGDGEMGKTTLLRTWRQGLEAHYAPEEAQIALVDYRRSSLDALDSPLLFGYAPTAVMLKDMVDNLKTVLDSRLPNNARLTLEELRSPRQWEGPQYFLLVDDYEGIVTPSGNPLAPLVDLIANGRDVGFHVILTRRIGGMSRSGFEAVMGRFKEMSTPGLIMGGDPGEGVLIGTQKASPLPSGRGYLVRRNQRTIQVQTVLTEG